MAVAHYDASIETALNQCQMIAGVDLDSPAALKRQVERWGLGGCATSFVLSPGDYQLLLVDAPAVAEAELKEAIRWRVKDLVSYDISTAVIDCFALPEDAYRGRSQMLYVVVIPQSTATRIEAFVDAAGLQLDCIDIPELVLQNLTPLVDGETALGQAWMCLQQPTGYINLVADDAVYLSRHIELPAAPLNGSDSAEGRQATSVVLDIQRSLDYYESQIGKPPCLKLLICPLQAGETPLLTEIRQNLSVEVEQLDLGELLVSRQPLTPQLQDATVIAVAAALRQEGAA